MRNAANSAGVILETTIGDNLGYYTGYVGIIEIDTTIAFRN